MDSRGYVKLILDALKSTLASEGFKQRGSTFFREGKDAIVLLNVQKSTKSDRQRLVVTLNCGVFLRILGAAFGNSVTIWSCHWRQRIGHLIPEKRDKWWEITSESGAIEAAKEIKRLTVEFAVPQLLTRDTASKLLTCWKSGEYGGLTGEQRKQFVKAVEGAVHES
jgi:hypothetical protein